MTPPFSPTSRSSGGVCMVVCLGISVCLFLLLFVYLSHLTRQIWHLVKTSTPQFIFSINKKIIKFLWPSFYSYITTRGTLSIIYYYTSIIKLTFGESIASLTQCINYEWKNNNMNKNIKETLRSSKLDT